jgi:predicted glycoside hydrolase/deacetylase ChbG (UPF0249 family)
MRFLIVNADDFGLSRGVNRGVIRAHERGIVTSATLMVCAPAVEEAASYARSHPRLDLGLHLDLGEWAYRDGEWAVNYQVIQIDDTAAVDAEVGRQLAKFRRLIGRDPSHIDSHQHAHKANTVRPVACHAANSLGIPLRMFQEDIRYEGTFYGQTPEGHPRFDAISADSLAASLDSLPVGWTELSCHPGLDHDSLSSYNIEREIETESLCDPRIRMHLQRCGIQLKTFRDFLERSGA